MTGKRDAFDLHPYGILGAAAAGRPDHAQQQRLDAVADPAPAGEQASAHRRLFAVLTRRLDSASSADARTERAF